jgi:lysophospholipase L1-like esterase
MKLVRTTLLAAIAALTLTIDATAAPVQAVAAPPAVAEYALGTTPAPRNKEYPWMSVERWHSMVAAQDARAALGDVDLMFVGDSITEGWQDPLWQHYFGQFRPANFGIGGDQTGNLLWRLQRAPLRLLHPRAIVLLVGVNNLNLGPETPAQAAAGVAAVLATLRQNYPDAKILLNGVFPYKHLASSEQRVQVRELNRLIAALGDERQVTFRNYGPLFLDAHGDISPEIMADFLHLTPKGYQIWGDAMLPDIRKLMGNH